MAITVIDSCNNVILITVLFNVGHLISVPWILLTYRWPLLVMSYIVNLQWDMTHDKMINLGVMLLLVYRLLASSTLNIVFIYMDNCPFLMLTFYVVSDEF